MDFDQVKMEPPFYENSSSNAKAFTKVLSDKLNIALTSAWKFKTGGILNFEQKDKNYAIARKDKSGEF